LGMNRGFGSNIVASLCHTGAASVPVPLTGVNSEVGDRKVAVSVNTGSFSEGYRVVAYFEGVSSGVGDGEAAVSGKAGGSSGAR